MKPHVSPRIAALAVAGAAAVATAGVVHVTSPATSANGSLSAASAVGTELSAGPVAPPASGPAAPPVAVTLPAAPEIGLPGATTVPAPPAVDLPTDPPGLPTDPPDVAGANVAPAPAPTPTGSGPVTDPARPGGGSGSAAADGSGGAAAAGPTSGTGSAGGRQAAVFLVPNVSINDVSQSEGNSGTTSFTFTVSLDASSPFSVSVDWATVDGTATVAGSDYSGASGTVTFAAGETTKDVTVDVLGDTVIEPNETFFVNLTTIDATIADGQGQATVVNDDSTIVVNSTNDAVDADPGDGVCLTAASECTLRAAVQEANALSGTQTVVLQTGATYPLTITGADENGSATGDLDVTDGVAVQGNNATISATGLGDRILEVVGSGFAVSITNATFTGGSVTATTGTTADDGGAINVPGTTTPLTLTSVTVSNSQATRYGGGVSSSSALTIGGSSFSGNSSYDGAGVVSSASVHVTGSSFTDNAAGNCGGGLVTAGGGSASGLTFTGNTAGVCGGGVVHAQGTLTFGSSTFDGNTAGTWGGGLLISADGSFSGLTVKNGSAQNGGGVTAVQGDVTLSTSDVHGNQATGAATSAGGGIVLCKCVGPVTLTTTDVDVHQNSAVNGGGIIQVNGTLSMTGGTVHDNIAQFFGGGFVNASTDSGFPGTMSGVTFRGNDAGLGGAILQNKTSPQLTITDSTIADNGAYAASGGISADGPLVLRRSTVSGNSSPSDGALTAGGPVTIESSTISSNAQPGVVTLGPSVAKNGSVTMTDSTVTNNTAGIVNSFDTTFTVANSIVADQAAAGADCAGTITSGDHNLSSDATCGWAGTGDVQGTPALLGPLANNGGPTLTHLPGVGSPAIDTGATAAIIDQRGVTRPQGTTDDKGAVEVGP